MNAEAFFIDQLRRVTLRWRTRFDAELKAQGQTLVRARALVYLARRPEGMTQRELTEQLMVEHPTLVRILDALEEQGLIRREPIEGNRRANRLILSPAALPMVTELEAAFAAEAHRVLRHVPPDKLALATEVLRGIAEQLEEGA